MKKIPFLTLYRHEKCTTCKKAETFLKSHDREYNTVNIVEMPPTYQELEQMLKHINDIRKLFNTSGQRYRELGLKDKVLHMSTGEALKILAFDGMLIKRPFLIGDGVGLVGFNETKWKVVFSEDNLSTETTSNE